MNNGHNLIVLTLAVLMVLTSCVSKKDFLALQTERDLLQQALDEERRKANTCQDEQVDLSSQISALNTQLASAQNTITDRDARIKLLQDELDYQKRTNTNLLDRMNDLSVLTQQEADNVKKSLESINQQSRYIQDLNESIQAKDSLNLALVMNLKRSLDDINDEDVQVEVRGGVVYVSISDRLLFRSGSFEITNQAKGVLGKVAKVINDHNEINVMVEGHTDSIPISNTCMVDNWDLSVKRATSVVRVLTDEYSVAPGRLTAAGRSEFVPKDTNETSSGRSINRRTEIVITPKLDQFFKLLEDPSTAGQ